MIHTGPLRKRNIVTEHEWTVSGANDGGGGWRAAASAASEVSCRRHGRMKAHFPWNGLSVPGGFEGNTPQSWQRNWTRIISEHTTARCMTAQWSSEPGVDTQTPSSYPPCGDVTFLESGSNSFAWTPSEEVWPSSVQPTTVVPSLEVIWLTLKRSGVGFRAPREVHLGLSPSDVAESEATLEPTTSTGVQDWNVRGQMMSVNRVDEATRGGFKATASTQVVKKSRNWQPFNKTVPSNKNSVTHETQWDYWNQQLFSP